MAMQQCPNGHLYDDSKNASCPYCVGGGGSINVTMPLGGAPTGVGGEAVAFPSTTPIMDTPTNQPVYTPPEPQVAAQRQPMPATEAIEEKFQATQYVSGTVNEKGIVEIRGWLVCLEGSKRGVDFKICGERSTIGRGPGNDIRLDFDTAISQGVNATISYDNRHNKFYITPGNSKNNIYCNDQLLLSSMEIQDYNILEIGNTKMIFRSLCNEQFNWPKNEVKNSL